jgi:hypothetical protein
MLLRCCEGADYIARSQLEQNSCWDERKFSLSNMPSILAWRVLFVQLPLSYNTKRAACRVGQRRLRSKLAELLHTLPKGSYIENFFDRICSSFPFETQKSRSPWENPLVLAHSVGVRCPRYPYDHRGKAQDLPSHREATSRTCQTNPELFF